MQQQDAQGATPPETPPQVVHVEAGRHLFGGARQVLYLLEGLAAEGSHGSLLVCPPGSEIAAAAVARGLRVAPLAMGGDLDAALVPRLLQVLRRERPALLHLHSRRGADVYGAAAGRLAGVPVVCSRRVPFPPNPWLRRVQTPLYDHVIAISAAIGRSLEAAGLPAGRLSVVPSAVDARRFAQPASREALRARFDLPAEVEVVAMVAQLIPRKGHHTFLEALARLHRRRPRVRALLFGRGALEAALREHRDALGLGQIARFAGFVPDMERWMGALDLLAHPARDEGLGVALLEAAAAGCPVVATPVGGIPEIVRHGDTGRLVPVDDPDALAAAMEAALSEPGATAAMAARARALVLARHSVAAMTAGNLAVYRRLAAARAPGPG